MSLRESQELFQRAQKVIPGGVNSPVRAFGSVGGDPVFFEQGRGCHLYDVAGREYIDVMASWGPLILGHADSRIESAVRQALEKGTTFGASTQKEVELAELIVQFVPSIEKVRLVSSGTEATMTALRLARGATGRDRVIKFEGCYHGHNDSFLIKAGSGALTLGVPSSPGVPKALAELTSSAKFNDLASVEALLNEHKNEYAAIIVEPIAGNMGVVPPQDGFLQGLRKLSTEHGTLLIFDEVITGFRVGSGGAQERFDIAPDLTTLGKILGGGLPMGALGGKAELMDQLAPTGPVYQAGTLSGNPLATAAGLAMLNTIKAGGSEFYQDLELKGKRLHYGIQEAIQATGVTALVQRVGSMMTLFFNDVPVVNMDSLSNLKTETYSKFFHGLLERGVCFPPSQYEAFFVSQAHRLEDIDRLIEVIGDTLKMISEAD